jgi:small subunit ribosomal protein S5
VNEVTAKTLKITLSRFVVVLRSSKVVGVLALMLSLWSVIATAASVGGYAKANEVPQAVEKALKDGEASLKRMKQPIAIRESTIPHRVIGRYRSSRVILVPAGPGTGVKAGPGVREVLQSCGIRNILTKTHGSTNPINLVKATIQGLMQLRSRQEVERLRGVKL